MRAPTRLMMLLFPAFLLGWGAATADDALVVALPQLPPWAYMDGKNVTGILPEILGLVVAPQKTPMTISLKPYSRVIRSVETGDVDLAVLFEEVPAATVSLPVATLYSQEIAFFFRSGQALPPPSGSPLYIATLRGTGLDPRFDNDPDLIKIFTNSYEHSVRLAVAGRVDGLIGPTKQIEYLLAQNTTSQNDFKVYKTLEPAELCLHLAKDAFGKIDRAVLAQTVRDLEATGEIEAIVDRYLAEWGYLYPSNEALQ